MMKDLYIAFTEKEITTFGGVSLLYKMLDNCHFNEALSSVGLPQQGSSRGKSPEQLIYGLFTGVWCGASCQPLQTTWLFSTTRWTGFMTSRWNSSLT